MPAERELVAAVTARIVACETFARLGRVIAVDVPSRSPSVLALAGRAFPPSVLDRRLRFVAAVGWDADTELPTLASPADHLAARRAAGTVASDDEDVRTMLASVRGESFDTSSWDEFFDAVVDGIDPDWRSRPRVQAPAPAWSRLEAVSVLGDAAFGRRRSASLWSPLREAVRVAGNVKRRWFG